MGLAPFYGVQTASGSPQPAFGTALTAAVVPPPDPFSGELGPGSNQTQVQLAVTSTRGFLPGHEILVGPTADFKPGIATALADRGVVKSVVSATALLVQGLQKNHAATGEWVILNEVVGSVRIRYLAGAVLYIGNASTVSSTDLSVMEALAPGNLFETGTIAPSQPWQTSAFWVLGAAADTFISSYGQL